MAALLADRSRPPAPCRSEGSCRHTIPETDPGYAAVRSWPRGNRAFVLAEEAQDAWLTTPLNKGDSMQQSFTLKDPLELFATFSPFQTHCDLSMLQKTMDSPNSPAYRQMAERTYSRDHTIPVSAGNKLGGFPTQTTDPSARPSRPRARSNSTPDKHLPTPGHPAADYRKNQDRNTWSSGSTQAIVQRTSSTSQRSPLITGRNQSQTNLHRSPSNSPTISRRYSKSSQPTPTRPRPILFYHKHDPHYGFTNFSNHAVKYEGEVYPTSEHLFQSLKACAPLTADFRLI